MVLLKHFVVSAKTVKVTTTTTTTKTPSGGCFPSSGKVFHKSGKSVTMSELQIGDLVQTGINNSSCTLHAFLNIFLSVINAVLVRYTFLTSINSHDLQKNV